MSMGSRRRSNAGFTLFEMIISVAVIGIMALAFYPNLMNPTDVRSLDMGSREILSTLQLAKWQAASAKLNHRVRFYSLSGRWWYAIEFESQTGTWTAKPGQPTRSVATKFVLTLTLPANASVIFTPTGFVDGFDTARNTVALASAKLTGMGQSGRRLIRIFASGSFLLSADNGG
ncbi:MAG: prepilin-type N-terminal cleavage/methylation domain-containing protein [Candidatus Aminicenantes bacterium]|nr:prepilin-type N-terminal cleavage/methylation domain-containing protein [Candidatus Aminicenantes bacterium]